MIRLSVAVIFGGRSAEHEISCVSARSVVDALDPELFDVVLVGVDKQGGWHLLPEVPSLSDAATRALPAVAPDDGPTIALAERTEGSKPRMLTVDGQEVAVDVVFPLMHGPYGEDGTIQGLLELAGIPYVGAGVLGSALGMDKAAQKVMLRAAGIEVVLWHTFYERDRRDDPDQIAAHAQALGWPIFVKPANMGSSVGITKVHDASELDAALDEAFGYDRRIVLEKGVEAAREIEVGVVGNDDPVASVPGEIVPSGEFYDYASKYLDGASEAFIPADLPAEVVSQVQRLAVQAFQALDIEGMARVDLFYRADPFTLVVNEVNTIPGFTEISMFPKLWEASGVPYRQLLIQLINLALDRYGSRGGLPWSRREGFPTGERPGR